MNVFDVSVQLTYPRQLTDAEVASVGGVRCHTPAIAAPLWAVLRGEGDPDGGWLTPRDPDRSAWEHRPITKRVTITPGLKHRLMRDYGHHPALRITTSTQSVEGTPAACLAALQHEKSAHLRVKPLVSVPLRQPTLASFWK